MFKKLGKMILPVGIAGGGLFALNYFHPLAAKGQGAGTPAGGLKFPYGIPGGWVTAVVTLIGAALFGRKVL